MKHLRLLVQMDSLMSDEIGSLNESLFAKTTLLTNTRVDQQMLLVRVPSKESFTAIFTSVDDVLVDHVMAAEAAFGCELQRASFTWKHFLVGMGNLNKI